MASYNPATRMLTAISPHLLAWSVLRLNAPAALAAIKSELAGFFGVPTSASRHAQAAASWPAWESR